MRFMDVRTLTVMGAECTVARSGYTGEDGFEISTPPDIAREIAEELLANPCVAPIGLGARASLGGWIVPSRLGYRREHDAGRSGVVLGDPESPPPRRRARGRVPRGRDR